MTYFVLSNIMKLLNAFDLNEDSINASNYDTALKYFTGNFPDTVQGLDIGFCDMDKLLSEVR